MAHKILVITGSYRANGNTAILADAFAKGAKEAGNEVEVFDAAKAQLDGCHGDKSCHKTGFCGIKDDGIRMHELLAWADTLVLVSPLYFGGFTAYAKKAIDRLYPYAAAPARAKLGVKTMYLIAAGGTGNAQDFQAMEYEFSHVAKVLKLEEGGKLICTGLGGPGEVKKYDGYLRQAVRMGMQVGAYTNDI